MGYSIVDRLISLATRKPLAEEPPAPDAPTQSVSPAPTPETRVAEAAERMEHSLNELLATLREIERRDPKLLATLHAKYGLPKRMTSLANDISAFVETMEPFL
jgi:hypothetical protein